jgi:hypothetical protein
MEATMMDSINHNNPSLVTTENHGQNNKILADSQAKVKESPEIDIFQHTDKVSLQYSSETQVTYSSSLTMENNQQDKYGLLRNLVTSMLKEQGVAFQVPTGNGEINISELNQEEAQELVSEEGYFGVDQTSDRIVDFAIAIAGGDPSRLDAIKEGIEDGFKEAEEVFGGTLPDISYGTYDAVMEKLDAWAESGNDNQVV